MFYILTYDIGIERVNKVKKITREFLKWEQNSVVTGELSDSQAMELKGKLKEIIDTEKDHIIIFSLRSRKFLDRVDLGTPKTEIDEDSFFL